MIGTVPIYDAVVYYHKPLIQITAEEWIDIVRMHAEDGVDFMTLHCGVNRETADKFKRNKRLTNIVSRGGSIIFAWMEMTGEENPFYAILTKSSTSAVNMTLRSAWATHVGPAVSPTRPTRRRSKSSSRSAN